jgi:GNAT superfamily N-acetyltransferase
MAPRATERPRASGGRSVRMTVRPATEADLDLLVVHRRRMWEEIGGRTTAELDAADPVYRRWFVREHRAGRLTAFVVEDRSGAPLGSGAVWLTPAQPRPGPLYRTEVPYILSMFTEPAARRRGVAARIIRTIVRWARARRYPRVTLHASTAGRPVYERLGFENGSEMRLPLLPVRRVRSPPRAGRHVVRPRRRA